MFANKLRLYTTEDCVDYGETMALAVTWFRFVEIVYGRGGRWLTWVKPTVSVAIDGETIGGKEDLNAWVQQYHHLLKQAQRPRTCIYLRYNDHVKSELPPVDDLTPQFDQIVQNMCVRHPGEAELYVYKDGEQLQHLQGLSNLQTFLRQQLQPPPKQQHKQQQPHQTPSSKRCRVKVTMQGKRDALSAFMQQLQMDPTNKILSAEYLQDETSDGAGTNDGVTKGREVNWDHSTWSLGPQRRRDRCTHCKNAKTWRGGVLLDHHRV